MDINNFTFKFPKEKGELVYSYISGSHLYNLNVDGSDIDTKGIFIIPKEKLYGLDMFYEDLVSDDRNDNNFYEIGKFFGMLLKSNPNTLEALFVPTYKIITPPNDVIIPLFENKEEFITKECFKPFIGYARAQIEKAKGLNKMINWEKERVERKGVLDFTYTFFNQGSTKLENWLSYRGLKQEYCGLVKIPNMQDMYGVYYDWGTFFLKENITIGDIFEGLDNIGKLKTDELVSDLKASTTEEKESYENLLNKSYISNMVDFIINFYGINDGDIKDRLGEWYENKKPTRYNGCVGPKSQSLKLTSVSKGEKPICYASFNENAYKKHCVDYRNYKDWEKYRNQKRYESNLHKNYDSKNMMHCFRLIHMGKEIAEGNGVNVERTWDREFLLDIRNHKFEYDELIENLNSNMVELDKAINTSTIKESIDIGLINDILINIRKNCYKK